MDSRKIASALKDIVSEDYGSGDVTMAFTPDQSIKARIVSNSDGFISGLSEARALFILNDVKAETRLKDGARIRKGDTILLLEGSSRRIFSYSRSALNILGRMSGITTLTRKYVDLMEENRLKTRIMATRKTTPLFRVFEKKAVKLGGGLTHRMGLYDMILIKHDHLMMFGGDVAKAVTAAKKSRFKSRIEVEVDNIEDAITAAMSKPDVIMLDNMATTQVASVLKRLSDKGLRKGVKIEVSGGMNLTNVVDYARCGVDYISIGELTHSPKSLDYSLKVAV
ncbi:MAG: carboxylating nicotinate-nucleotide diphosphorylase [Candidatus Altiarchaeota archaeon]|nr:carboxylating nicotinate-nucleotide diphosphorylase [Candidatus Altiarchaeota archaeon]